MSAIVQRAISDLIVYANNARTHSPEQVNAIANSIQEFGFNNPVLIDSRNGVIAGHGRVLAAKQLGWAEVPTLELDHLTDDQKRAYIIADNQLALTAGWNYPLLASEIEAIAQAGMDVTLLGFTAGDLDLIERLGVSDPIANPQQEWQGMPAFEQDNQKAFRQVLVSFKEQADVDAFAEATGLSITPQTRFTWYPHQEWDRTNSTHSYVSTEQ